MPETLLEFFSKLKETIYDGLVTHLPRVLTGILVLLIAWLGAKLIANLVSRSLRALRFDVLMERLQVTQQLEGLKVEKTPSQLLGRLTYWFLMLLIIVGFAEATQLTIVSEKIGQFLNYLPNLLIGVIILIGGMFIANKLRDFVTSALAASVGGTAKLIGNILFYLLTIFVVLTVLDQLQFDIDLISSNVMILIGGVALAFAIGYGLGAKEIFPNIISSYYSKGMFTTGDHIRLGEVEGRIIEITNLSVVVETDEGHRYIPARKFINEEVEVLARATEE